MVIPERVGDAPDSAIYIVKNWFAEFKDREQD